MLKCIKNILSRGREKNDNQTQIIDTIRYTAATIIEIEYENLSDFCHGHGGIRIHDSWLDGDGKTTRFLTEDRRHCDEEYYSYVYVSKDVGPSRWAYLVSLGNTHTVATCIDEEGDECYILCESPKLGDKLQFQKLGFSPYCRNPKPNKFGRNRYDY